MSNEADYDFDMDEPDGDDILFEFYPLQQRKFISIKVINGDVYAEDTDGQMVIVREDGTVSTFLHGDNDWVHGELTTNKSGSNYEGSAWDIIGYHFGMTMGYNMERSRGGRATN